MDPSEINQSIDYLRMMFLKEENDHIALPDADLSKMGQLDQAL